MFPCFKGKFNRLLQHKNSHRKVTIFNNTKPVETQLTISPFWLLEDDSVSLSFIPIGPSSGGLYGIDSIQAQIRAWTADTHIHTNRMCSNLTVVFMFSKVQNSLWPLKCLVVVIVTRWQSVLSMKLALHGISGVPAHVPHLLYPDVAPLSPVLVLLKP